MDLSLGLGLRLVLGVGSGLSYLLQLIELVCIELPVFGKLLWLHELQLGCLVKVGARLTLEAWVTAA